MKFPSISANCIWCGRRLIQRGTPVDCSEPFGPRPRTDEHIIPQSLFGKIITTDLCKCCNDFFGQTFDYAIARDHQICQAAEKVGISVANLWPSFEGYQVLPSGKKVRVDVRHGQARPRPQLAALKELSIPIVDGVPDKTHIEHFAARLKRKVIEKGVNVPPDEVERRVRTLVDKLQAEPTGTHHDPVIGEGVTPTPLGSKILFTRDTKPWETQWCMAKMALELSYALWPRHYKAYLSPCVEEWKRFMRERRCSPDGKQGIGIFKVFELPAENAALMHSVEGLASPEVMYWKFTFFGTIQWVYDSRHEGENPPPPFRAIKFRILNPFGKPEDDATVEVKSL